MFKCIECIGEKKVGIFAAGAVFGRIGIDILTSDTAKGIYAKITAVALRGKDRLMETAAEIQENAMDIYEEAIIINEEKEMYEDHCCGCCSDAEDAEDTADNSHNSTSI